MVHIKSDYLKGAGASCEAYHFDVDVISPFSVVLRHRRSKQTQTSILPARQSVGNWAIGVLAEPAFIPVEVFYQSSVFFPFWFTERKRRRIAYCLLDMEEFRPKVFLLLLKLRVFASPVTCLDVVPLSRRCLFSLFRVPSAPLFSFELNFKFLFLFEQVPVAMTVLVLDCYHLKLLS